MMKMKNLTKLNSMKFKLSGADNEGIVHSLTKKLAVNNINTPINMSIKVFSKVFFINMNIMLLKVVN